MDKKISELAGMAAADVSPSDNLVLDDTSEAETKRLPVDGLLEALGSFGAVRFSSVPVADGAVLNGQCYIYVDTAQSPPALAVKARSSSGVLFDQAL